MRQSEHWRLRATCQFSSISAAFNQSGLFCHYLSMYLSMSYKILYAFSPERSPRLERSPQHPPGDILLGTCRPEEILHTSLVDSQEMFPGDLLKRSYREPGNRETEESSIQPCRFTLGSCSRQSTSQKDVPRRMFPGS